MWVRLDVAPPKYTHFAPPAGLSQHSLFLWFATFVALTRLSLALFHVPHMALGVALDARESGGRGG